ncbi:hypothetical protein, partial [Alicyclobacillus cellulosilyticus]|uniref:hypothetical protein n=1 Tax=Alicyclobacillus cellulosilyticus TaxID=1003997 RepID=UPI001E616BE5
VQQIRARLLQRTGTQAQSTGNPPLQINQSRKISLCAGWIPVEIRPLPEDQARNLWLDSDTDPFEE